MTLDQGQAGRLPEGMLAYAALWCASTWARVGGQHRLRPPISRILTSRPIN